ncbi:MAG: hypothetical protein ACI87E_001288 [Mariniblastus sp.]|jgi:hypothetical protein
MTSATRKKLTVIALAIGAFVNSASCGATEWPGRRLPTLIERSEAELIVFADVVETARTNGGQLSRLKVISIIKSGERKVQDEIKVLIPLGSHWPYTFKPKSKAIAFLKFDEKRKLYVGFNGRNGGLDVDETTGLSYVRQYAKLSGILKEKNPRKLLELKLEWNVEFALSPTTRSQAAHGIHILWIKAQKLKLLTNDETNSSADLLTASQKNRICQSIANEVPVVESYGLIKLLQRHKSTEIDGYLLKSLHQSLNTEEAVPLGYLTISKLAVELLPHRVGFKLSKTLESAYEDYQERCSDFYYHIEIGDEHTEAEKRSARAVLIKEWRDLTTEFLEIPELEKIQGH